MSGANAARASVAGRPADSQIRVAAAASVPADDTRTVDAVKTVAPVPVEAEPDPFAEFELRRNALKQAFRAAASQDKEQK